MQITLDQLKEIAKAGYGIGSVYRRIINKCSIDYDDTGSILIYHQNMIAVLRIDIYSKDNVYINADGYYFNHLAAIRKMEELGLIEKYRNGNPRFD